jgi:flagellar protein FliS
MPAINPWKSYHQTATLTAPPGQLILMLYDGALRFLERALQGFELKDPAQLNMTVNNNLGRARDIIRELDCALNLEEGGDLAQTLHQLYEYFESRIHLSNVRKQRHGVKEVIQHLNVLREAWAAMLRGESSPPTENLFAEAELSGSLVRV